jgi:hypothetical protein
MTVLNSKWKVVGRGQESGETEKERGREVEHCCNQVVVLVIKLSVRENIYDEYRRIILDHLDGHYVL